MRHVLGILVIGLLLAGCARGGPPAPVIYGGGDDRGTAPTAPAPAPTESRSVRTAGTELPGRRPSGAGIHTAQPGDTVYGIARRYGVPIRALIEANDLSPPYELLRGQRLRIPLARHHEVERGDTLYSISRQYGVDMRELARINGLDSPYTIVVGELLRIPSGTAPARDTRTAARDTDTARRDGTETIAEAPPPRRKPARFRSAETRVAEGPGADATPASTTPADTTPADTTPEEIPQPPPRAASRFLWPVEGDILSRFGPQDGGLHNDGINIAAPRGTPVKAADNGVVAYVGNELRGFGNLLLIQHAGGWITAYAHVDTILVDRGEEVRRGDTVARVGNSGNVSRPQLHFEVRRGTDAVDPLDQLGRSMAAGES